jgi:AcrR family transcriptional regulator
MKGVIVMRKKEQPGQETRLRQAIHQRQEQEKRALRQTILQAAAQLFLEHGYDHFSLRKVAERIGYSPTTIYIYFRNKDDLLFTVVNDGFTRFSQQLETAAACTDDPWERIMELGHTYITFGLQNPAYYQMMFLQRNDFLMQKPEGADQPRIQAFQILQNSIQQAIDAGVIRPGSAESYSDMLWAFMHGTISLAISVPLLDERRLQQVRDSIQQLLSQGLRQP